jgi:hypothetical protein
MEANELRIGNYVYNDYLKKNKQIKGLFNSEIWLCEIGEYESDQRCSNEAIEPIPLTEDWLLKLGFEKPLNATWCFFGDIEIDLTNGFKVYLLGGVKTINLTSVHQLQNFVFALTQKEIV